MSSMRAARPILPWGEPTSQVIGAKTLRLRVPDRLPAKYGHVGASVASRGKDSPVRPIPSELPRRRDHCKNA